MGPVPLKLVKGVFGSVTPKHTCSRLSAAPCRLLPRFHIHPPQPSIPSQPQGDGSVVPGLEDVLVGTRPGSKFRALVPPEMGYATAPGALPQVPPALVVEGGL